MYPAWKEYMSLGTRYEGRTQLAAVDAIPPLHYKSTIDIDYIECVMKKSLSRAVVVTDCNMIKFGRSISYHWIMHTHCDLTSQFLITDMCFLSTILFAL